MLSATNSVRRGPYIFQPTKYDKNGNLYCTLIKQHTYNKFVNNRCKLTGLYNFNTETFEIIFCSPGFLDKNNHKKLLNWFLKQYDWID